MHAAKCARVLIERDAALNELRLETVGVEFARTPRPREEASLVSEGINVDDKCTA